MRIDCTSSRFIIPVITTRFPRFIPS